MQFFAAGRKCSHMEPWSTNGETVQCWSKTVGRSRGYVNPIWPRQGGLNWPHLVPSRRLAESIALRRPLGIVLRRSRCISLMATAALPNGFNSGRGIRKPPRGCPVIQLS